MKQLHWQRLPNRKVKSTIWEKDVDSAAASIDVAEVRHEALSAQ